MAQSQKSGIPNYIIKNESHRRILNSNGWIVYYVGKLLLEITFIFILLIAFTVAITLGLEVQTINALSIFIEMLFLLVPGSVVTYWFYKFKLDSAIEKFNSPRDISVTNWLETRYAFWILIFALFINAILFSLTIIAINEYVPPTQNLIPLLAFIGNFLPAGIFLSIIGGVMYLISQITITKRKSNSTLATQQS